MADSIDRVFVHALNTVKKIPPRTARPPTAERLKLYGLYKQSMEGDVEGVMDRPLGNTTDVYAECEKWDAWFAQRGLSRTEAKRRYISTLIETMHRHASQTSEARELVAELEFVWDQIKANVSSSSSGSARGGKGGGGGGGGEGGSAFSSPVRPVVVPPSLASPQQQQVQVQRQHMQAQRGLGSIGGRLAQPSYEDMVAIANASAGRRGDVRDSSSQLRVLSPVSQPDEMYQRRGSGMRMRSDRGGDRGSQEDDDEGEEDEDEDEDEEFEEAQDTLYDDDDDDNDNDQHISDEQEEADSNDRQSSSQSSLQQQQHSKKKTSSPSPPRGRKPAPKNKNKRPTSSTDPGRWRRRVEQALTNMTAEVAALREQMETRAIHHRRRSSAWAWLKWLAWVTLRQVIWDLAILGMLLIWMRIKGDRRVEGKLKAGWSEVKRRLPGRVRSLRRFGLPLLP